MEIKSKNKIRFYIFYSCLIEIFLLLLSAIILKFAIDNNVESYAACNNPTSQYIPYIIRHYNDICGYINLVHYINSYFIFCSITIAITFFMQLKYVVGVKNLIEEKSLYPVIGFWVLFLFGISMWLFGVNTSSSRLGEIHLGNISSLIGFSIALPIVQLVVNILTWERSFVE